MNTEAVEAAKAPDQLEWAPGSGYWEDASLMDPGGGVGVKFTLEHMPTCYRRGQWKLTISVEALSHYKWGCLDEQDQPMRYYHLKANALSEAQCIATVMWLDRMEVRG